MHVHRLTESRTPPNIRPVTHYHRETASDVEILTRVSERISPSSESIPTTNVSSRRVSSDVFRPSVLHLDLVLCLRVLLAEQR